jgi:tripartite-type tricarboxylate transporter receptor subunit TctC
MNQNRRSLLVTAASVITAASFPAIAQSTFPSRPIRLVVPFPPGGQLLNA